MRFEAARARGVVAAGVREFFCGRGYVEVQTPLLAPFLIPETAIEVFKARFEHPFKGGRDMFLAPSPELWMKRLVAEGMGNIFQICKAFRNAESIGPLHNPEFTILEYYTAGADYMASLELTEALFESLVSASRERLSGVCGEEALSRLGPPFARMTMAEAFERYAGFDLTPFAPSSYEEEGEAALRLREKALSLGLACGEGDSWEAVFNRIFVDRVEGSLPKDRPVALLDYPRGVRCLARPRSGGPWCERWELYLGGVETANCFTEETDPARTGAYFREEARLKEKALVPHPPDAGFPGLFAGGLPPCSGVAIGFDRLVMAFLGETSLGGVVFFPFQNIL